MRGIFCHRKKTAVSPTAKSQSSHTAWQAGTHTPQQGDVAGPVITETLVVIGPRLRGDDGGWVRAKDT